MWPLPLFLTTRYTLMMEAYGMSNILRLEISTMYTKPQQITNHNDDVLYYQKPIVGLVTYSYCQASKG